MGLDNTAEYLYFDGIVWIFRLSLVMKQTLLFVCAFLQSIIAFTQHTPAYVWWNPAQNEQLVMEGQAWPRQVQHPYDR